MGKPDADQCRRAADDCREQAERAVSGIDRDRGLKLAATARPIEIKAAIELAPPRPSRWTGLVDDGVAVSRPIERREISFPAFEEFAAANLRESV